MTIDTSVPLLLVDDNLQIRSAIRSILNDLGFRTVHAAASAEEAMRIFGERPVGAVICDQSLPGMGGLAFMQWMREQPRWADRPFLLLGEETDPGAVQALLAAGASDYLVKPFTYDHFQQKLEALLRPARRAAVAAARSGSPRALIGEDTPVEERIRKATILVVDDMATNIKVIAGMLTDDGYNVKVAISARKALELAQSAQPDLILLDIVMPEMSGFELCKRLKADPDTRDIPVIFLSSRDGADDVVGGLALGAADYVTKPVESSVLRARLRTQLRLAATLADLKRKSALAAANAQLRDDVDRLTRHELAPLVAGMLDAVERLQADPAASEALRSTLDTLGQHGHVLLRRATHGVDLHRLEQGRYDPAAEPIALEQLLEACARHAGVLARLEMPKTPLRAQGDLILARAAIDQLLQLALGFAMPDTPLQVSVPVDAQFAGFLLEWTGGMPPAVRAALTERPSLAGNLGEAALSLYAARLMAELQGGSVNASADGNQTRVQLRLPKVAPPA
ncbi:response regulator [Massilia sp. TS11]|uniref:response regulator n=1 Tax=Massilia sp. TS11 TaxID=2908003 RepID=UPI001EDBE05D|nr:response regulator [Massilia sp. TS11]MCG2583729.1 response regulator [Massilia sp. TS11]